MSTNEENEQIRIESSCEGLNISNQSDSCKEREITIEVESIENIDTTKVKEISVKIEFKGQIIAETDSFVVPETGECALNASGIIPMEEPSPQFLDDILANPVIFTVIDRTFSVKLEKDSVNESKKDSKRESKKAMSRSTLSIKSIPKSSNASFNVLGICNMDLGSLIKGRKLIKEKMIVELERSGSGQHLVPWPKLPRLSAFASTGEEHLISPQVNILNNIIDVTVESVYNVPRSIEDGTHFDAQILLPGFDDKLNAVIYPNGTLTSLIDCERMKQWVTLSHIEGRGALTKYKVNPDTFDVINPDNEIPDLEKVLRCPGPRIHWNKWRSSIMVKTGSNYFFARLANSRVWPIEVSIASLPASQKTAKGEKRSKTAVTPSITPERYIAYLRLGSLLYPGVTRVRVASVLHTYSPSDVTEKCGEEFVTQSVTNASLTKVKNGDKAKSSGKETEESKDSPASVLCNEDGNPVFIVVEVEVWKPYIPKREPEYFMERFSSYFLPKGKVSKKEMNLNLAQKNFSKVIEQMSYYIKDCYEKFILQVKNSDILNCSIEERFIQYLCQEGAFQKITLSLEDKILDLVGEKYGDIGKQKENITKVFVDLVSEMHNITNKFTTFKTESSKMGQVEANDLQLSAEEAIENGDYNLAQRYLLRKLWSNKLNPDYWLDYALYMIVLEDYEKCVESIREALSLDIEHQMALLMYGLMMTKMNDIYVAELTFQVLLTKYPDFIEGWVIFHLFYSAIGNLEGAEFTIQTAFRLEREVKENRTLHVKEITEGGNLHVSSDSGSDGDKVPDLAEGRYGIASYSKGRGTTDPLSWTLNLGFEYSIYLKTAVLLLGLRSYELAESVLVKESHPERHGYSLEYLYYVSVGHYLRGQYSEAVSHLKTAVRYYGKNCFLWSLMGHCYYKLHNYDNCIECFEYVIESYNRPNDIHLIHVRMGMYFMKAKKYKCAKKSFLSACKYSPSSETWLGLGAACYNLGEFEEAETALTEANYLDDMCPVVWGYLTLVNIQLQRYEVVELCYAETKKKNLKNEALIAQIETLMKVNRLKN